MEHVELPQLTEQQQLDPTIQLLLQIIECYKQALADRDRKILELLESATLAARRQFGARSEKTPPDQTGFFDKFPGLFAGKGLASETVAVEEGEDDTDEDVESPENEPKQGGQPQTPEQTAKAEEPATKAKKPRKQGIRRLPASLPREVIQVKPEIVGGCPECGGELVQIGTKCVEYLHIQPAQAIVKCYVTPTLKCVACEKDHDEPHITTVAAPPPAIKGSFLTQGTLAYVLNERFVKFVPPYRTEKEFAGYGVPLYRQTLINWGLKAAKLLEPIVNRLHHIMVTQPDPLHADETTFRVLHPDDRDKPKNTYMWVYRTAKCAAHPIIIFDWKPNRKGENPKVFLAEYRGYVHCDGYSVYHTLQKETGGRIANVGCNAHARRKFVEAVGVGRVSSQKPSAAQEAVDFYDALFALERKYTAEGLSSEERHKARSEEAVPILDDLHAWLLNHKTETGKFRDAVTYALNQWPYLLRYLDDGRLELSNNLDEQMAKLFSRFRANSLFANTPRGAKAVGIILSIVETATACGLVVPSYLEYLFTEIPRTDMTDPAAIDTLLPWNVPRALMKFSSQESNEQK